MFKKKNITWIQLYTVVYTYYYKKSKIWKINLNKKEIRLFTDRFYLLINNDSLKINKGEASEDLVFMFLDLHKINYLTKDYVLEKIGLDIDDSSSYFN